MNLETIGGSLSLFSAMILLTILAALLAQRKKAGTGPMGNCFQLMLAIGVAQALIYSALSLENGALSPAAHLALSLGITWSICIELCLVCRYLCLLIEFRGMKIQPAAAWQDDLRDRTSRIILACQQGACIAGGLAATIGDIRGWEGLPPKIVMGLGVLVVASCETELIRNRAIIGNGYTAVFLVLVPLPLAACLVQWTSGGIPVVSSAVTLSLLILYIMIQTSQARMMVEAIQAEQRTRLQLLASRMKPHFLYNALTTIYYLCARDPGKAQQAVEAFSSYLRDTMDSFASEDLVSFSWERKQIDHYMFLEKLRFHDQIDLRYELETEDFRLPPLAVQALVENAIKHGRDREHPSVLIRIRTVREPGWISLCVSDNGRGFDPARVREDDQVHLGLATVRERVRLLCGGTMEIDSRPGEGTSITLKLRSDLQIL